MTQAVLLAGATVVDATGTRPADVLFDATVREVGIGLDPGGATVIDATGCVVAPGFVDLHTHLREPGREDAETVLSGARAASLGGYTAIVAMPNTDPCMDNAEVVSFVRHAGARAAVEVLCSGAITTARAGEALAEMGAMADIGVRLFTDDGSGVQNDRLMRRALEYARGLGVTLAQHCEVAALSAGTSMHEGAVSSRLGISGQPAEAEELMVARDIALVRLTGASMHFLHMSTAGSVALIRAAKAEGLPITAEAAPHHFTLTDEKCATFDPVYKVHPPLRPESDRLAVIAGLADGTIDAIATDHAPHTPETKERPFDAAPPGMLGLEYAFALAFTHLGLDIADVVGLLSWKPAAIAGVQDRHGGPIAVGRPANLVVIDPDARWTIDDSGGASLSRNVPYVGMEVRGKVRHTFLDGEHTVADGVALR